MTTKKASFESRDPSHANEGTGNFSERANSGDSGKASFSSSDPSYATDSSMDEPISLDTPITPDGLAPTDEAVAEKSSFYTPDPDLGNNDPENPKKNSYTGVERRKYNRRSGTDRRKDVRFELDKTDRRQNEGRREDDHTPKYW